ncbi:phage major tail protein, TP901-1 family [Euryhalocaulis caribicus]|uniref:phage major tail protein, TP901-1 family n=1 Tax=Euryhalocaulis caribicus TaxID=1161401 RepID=UPI00039E89BA|nr:phage major tail protein, TP901-1 family [Euryhalocaulis caribicus]
MTAQAGKDMLIKIGDGAAEESFATLAGLRARTISLNARTVDATDADSAGGWRELLPGAGVKSASVSGTGIFRDRAADETARTVFFAGEARRFQLVIPDFGVLEGPFVIAALEYSGRFDGEAQYALTLASAGEIGFSAL